MDLCGAPGAVQLSCLNVWSLFSGNALLRPSFQAACYAALASLLLTMFESILRIICKLDRFQTLLLLVVLKLTSCEQAAYIKGSKFHIIRQSIKTKKIRLVAVSMVEKSTWVTRTGAGK